MPSVSELKQERRIQLLALLKSIDVSARSKLLVERLETFLDSHVPRADYIGAFMPLPTEPQIQYLWQTPGRKFCFPRTEDKEMNYYDSAQFERSQRLGVLEPVEGIKVSLVDLKWILVPGLCFDYKGLRLGRGLGFFDRVLCGFKGVSIGLCFEEQLVEQLEQDPWDIPVNVLVTDLHIRDFRKGN